MVSVTHGLLHPQEAGGHPDPGWDCIGPGSTDTCLVHPQVVDIGSFLFQAMKVTAGQTGLRGRKGFSVDGSELKYLQRSGRGAYAMAARQGRHSYQFGYFILQGTGAPLLKLASQ